MADIPARTDLEQDALRSSVGTIVRRMVGALAPEPVELTRLDDALIRDLGFNSLRLMELAFLLEELFTMDPAVAADAPPAGSVGDLCAYIVDQVTNGQAMVPEVDAVEAAIASI